MTTYTNSPIDFHQTSDTETLAAVQAEIDRLSAIGVDARRNALHTFCDMHPQFRAGCGADGGNWTEQFRVALAAYEQSAARQARVSAGAQEDHLDAMADHISNEARGLIYARALTSGLVDQSYHTTRYGRVADYEGEAIVRAFGISWRVVGVRASGDPQIAMQGGILITQIASAAQIRADHDALRRQYGETRF